MKKPTIFVDMDDTICHYLKHLLFCRHEYPDYNPYPQSRPGFFLELKPIEGAKENILKLVDQYDIWFLTRPSYKNAHCYTEKRLWIEEHYGLEWCNKLIICPDKSLIKGDYLVDDILWPDFEGKQIEFGHGDIKNWDDVYNELINPNNNKHYYIHPIDQNKIMVMIVKGMTLDKLIDDLANDLEKLGFSGYVYFDLFLSTGNSGQRYFVMKFESSFDYNSLETMGYNNPYLNKFSNEFLELNKESETSLNFDLSN